MVLWNYIDIQTSQIVCAVAIYYAICVAIYVAIYVTRTGFAGSDYIWFIAHNIIFSI
jgi:hypothetical protein